MKEPINKQWSVLTGTGIKVYYWQLLKIYLPFKHIFWLNWVVGFCPHGGVFYYNEKGMNYTKWIKRIWYFQIHIVKL